MHEPTAEIIKKKQCTLKWFSPSQVQNPHFNTPNGQCFHFLMNQLEPDEKFYSSILRIGYEKDRKKERKKNSTNLHRL